MGVLNFAFCKKQWKSDNWSWSVSAKSIHYLNAWDTYLNLAPHSLIRPNFEGSLCPKIGFVQLLCTGLFYFSLSYSTRGCIHIWWDTLYRFEIQTFQILCMMIRSFPETVRIARKMFYMALRYRTPYLPK